jgi:hypothetical protein
MTGQGDDQGRDGTARKGRPPAAELSREDRRKAALKANMARRKAQARARAAGTGTGRDDGNDSTSSDTE